MKKVVVVSFLFLFAVTFVFAQGKSDVIASVNNKKITKAYVDKALQEELSLLPEEQKTQENVQAMVNRIVNQKVDEFLISDAAKKTKMTVSKKELQNAVNAIKKNFKTETDFEADIKKQGLTKADFEKEVKENLLRIKYVSEEMKKRTRKPTDEELRNFYNNVISKIKGQDLNLSLQEENAVSQVVKNLQRIYGEQVKIRQIFIKYSDDFTKEQKKEVATKIKDLKKELSLQNANFAQLSVKYSDDQQLRERKGDLGFVLKEDITPEVAKIVFSLNVGDYNKNPLKTDNGYHFFRVEEKKAKMPIEFEDIKAYLSDTLYKQSIQNEYDKFISELKAEADISVY